MSVIKNYLCECGETNPDNFYKKEKNKCKKCRSVKNLITYHNKTEEEKKTYIYKQKEWISNNVIKVRVLAAKHRAIRKKIDFEIDEKFINELLISQDYKCKYSGLKLDIETIGSDENNVNPNTLSIDRIDSKLGYIKINIVLVAAIVNSMKNDLSEDDFIKVVNLICKNFKK